MSDKRSGTTSTHHAWSASCGGVCVWVCERWRPRAGYDHLEHIEVAIKGMLSLCLRLGVGHQAVQDVRQSPFVQANPLTYKDQNMSLITMKYGRAVDLELPNGFEVMFKQTDLLDPALQLIDELRAAADADVAAVHAYIQTREKQALHDVPAGAAHAVAQALILCAAASESVTGLIAADVASATAILQGSATAIESCVSANGS